MSQERRIVEVIWEDAHTSHGWQPKNEIITHHPISSRSVGYVLRDDEHELVIVESLGMDVDDETIHPGRGAYGCTVAFPKSQIREVHELRLRTSDRDMPVIAKPDIFGINKLDSLGLAHAEA